MVGILLQKLEKNRGGDTVGKENCWTVYWCLRVSKRNRERDHTVEKEAKNHCADKRFREQSGISVQSHAL